METEFLSDDQKLLAQAMSDYSEERWCAGWLTGLEFILWKTLADFPDDPNLAPIKQLSDRCGGWIVWNDETDRNDFLPMGQWLEIFGRSRYAA
jgi:hypothetical protein